MWEPVVVKSVNLTMSLLIGDDMTAVIFFPYEIFESQNITNSNWCGGGDELNVEAEENFFFDSSFFEKLGARCEI